MSVRSSTMSRVSEMSSQVSSVTYRRMLACHAYPISAAALCSNFAKSFIHRTMAMQSESPLLSPSTRQSASFRATGLGCGN